MFYSTCKSVHLWGLRGIVIVILRCLHLVFLTSLTVSQQPSFLILSPYIYLSSMFLWKKYSIGIFAEPLGYIIKFHEYRDEGCCILVLLWKKIEWRCYNLLVIMCILRSIKLLIHVLIWRLNEFNNEPCWLFVVCQILAWMVTIIIILMLFMHRWLDDSLCLKYFFWSQYYSLRVEKCAWEVQKRSSLFKFWPFQCGFF